MDGKALGAKVREEVAASVAELGHVGLATVLVGDDPASHIYIDLKHKAATEAGMDARDLKLPADLSEDEQVLANQYMTRLPHPELGEFWYVPTPVDFSETPVSIRSEAPHLGQHTYEVLGELGFSREQIEDLRRREVV